MTHFRYLPYLCGFYLFSFLLSTPLIESGAVKSQVDNKTKESEKTDARKLSASEVVDKLQNFYEKISDFQADFEQIYRHKIYGEEKKSSGKVYIQRPGKMRWEYKKPDKKVFIADGETIWVYDEKINQVTMQPFKDSDLPVAITFLVGKGKLKEEFEYKLVPHDKFNQLGMIVLELTPVKKSPQYSKLLFIISGFNFQIERTIIIDGAGNTNTMKFKNVIVNKKIDPQKFVFKPPKGATIVKP